MTTTASTSAPRTTELLGKLKQMAKKAGESLFERAGLALEVLADSHYITDHFDGDKDAFKKALAADSFPDVSMTGWFDRLLLVRQFYPDIEVWKQHKFSLQRLWVEYDEAHEETKPAVERQSPIPRKLFDEVKTELQTAQYHIRKAKEDKENWEQRCHDLERDLAEAQGRIETLESLIERYAPAMAVA